MPYALYCLYNTSSATAIKSSYVEMDKQFSCLENIESFMGVTAGGDTIHLKLFMNTQWCVRHLDFLLYFTQPQPGLCLYI